MNSSSNKKEVEKSSKLQTMKKGSNLYVRFSIYHFNTLSKQTTEHSVSFMLLLQGRETNSSYLCSNSRMDNITPEVDAFCCRVARNVNSLLFRKSWINFSLTWGAAWISLSVSKNFIFKIKKKRGNNSLVKMLSQKDSDHIFHFHINIFHFWESSTMAHHCIFSMKNPNAISVSMPTCHFDKFTTGQLLIFWWIFWQDAEPFVSAASRLSCCN